MLSSLRRLAGGSRSLSAETIGVGGTDGGRVPAGGVNVVGYLDRTSGLGERARVLVDVLRAGAIPYAEWPVDATASPVAAGGSGTHPERRVARPTTIAVVTAQQFPGLLDTHATVVAGVERLVGYWFWEVAAIPESQRAAIELVDEIWAPTTFVRDAYRAATSKPVHLVPLPIRRPDVADLDRAGVGLDERFTFLVSFDHLSVMERKHPLGAIEAFVRAFPRGDEPVRLLVKSLNGAARPRQHSTLRRAAARDARIDVVDSHTSTEHHMALIHHADAYVSLHRSEGLGLQPAAAMWLGTPVIASRYSGTLDLMDDASAELVDVRLIPARNTEGAYPPDAVWADPDLDQAAAAMRRLVDDPARRAEVVAAALARRAADADVSGAALLVSERLRSPMTAAADRTRRPVASVAPMPDTVPVPVDAPAVPSGRGDVRRVARAATAPVRNYLNNHFEMVKHEVRTHTGDSESIARLIHELEATVAEAGVHQARTIARLREEAATLSERIAELERVVDRLTAVVAATLAERDGT